MVGANRELQELLTPIQPIAALREQNQDRAFFYHGTLELMPTPQVEASPGSVKQAFTVVTTFSHSALPLSFWRERLPTFPLQGHTETLPSQSQAHHQPHFPNSDSIAGASGIPLIKSLYLTCDL